MSAYRTAAATKPLPARCAIRFDELPPASQALLRQISALDHSPNKRERHTRLHAILAATTGALVLVGATLWSQAATGSSEALLFDRRTPWDAGEITMVTVACFLVGVFLLGGIAALFRQRGAPLGTFWYAHRAYLLDCAHDRVVAYPLALLDDHDVVGETAQISFGEIDLQIAFDLPQEAVDFLIPLRKHATVAAECLARGAADEIPAANFIPDALLYRKNSRFSWDRAWALPVVAGLGLALAGRVVLPGLHASAAEARFVSACRESPEVCPEYQALYPGGARRDDVDDAYFAWTTRENKFGRYQAAFPEGRHLRVATTAAADLGAEAVELYRKRAAAAKEKGDPRLIDAMLTTLEVLRDAHTTTVPLRFTGRVDAYLARWDRSSDQERTDDQITSDPAIYGLAPVAGVIAKEELRSAILAAVDVVGAIDLHELQPGEKELEGVPELIVSYRIFRGEQVYQSTAKHKGTYVEIDIDWTFTFRWPTKPELGEVSLTLHTIPNPTVNSFVGSADLVYGAMMADDAKSLGPALRRALGLAPSAVVAPD